MNQLIDKFARLTIPVKLVILAVLVVIEFGVEYQFAYSPKKDKFKIKQTERENLQVKLAENQAVADNLPTFMEEVNVLNEQLKQALSLLPNEADIHSILRQLSITARKTNVELNFFKPGQTTSRGFYSEITMDLKIAGTYTDIAVFLNQVGKLQRIINVYDITFDPPKPDGRIIRTGITCKASTFMFRGGV